MAKSKKRSEPSSAMVETRPSKKRKAAEASKVRVKEIVEAEDDFSDDEVRVVKTKTAEKEDDDSEDDTDVEELQPHQIAPPPVVAPGFRLWQTSSTLASKGELTQVSKVSRDFKTECGRRAMLTNTV